MEQEAQTWCPNALSLDEEAHAEIAIVARRLRRIERTTRLAAEAEGRDDDAWQRVRDHCADALGALALASEALPEPDWHAAAEDRRLTVRSLSVDSSARAAWLGEKVLRLARQEFSLLATLASDPLKAWPKEELLERVWGFQARGRTRTVDTHASRLRLKLVEAGAAPGEFVVSVWGVGYALVRP